MKRYLVFFISRKAFGEELITREILAENENELFSAIQQIERHKNLILVDWVELSEEVSPSCSNA